MPWAQRPQGWAGPACALRLAPCPRPPDPPFRLPTRALSARPPRGRWSYLASRPGLPHSRQRRPVGRGSPRGALKTARGGPLAMSRSLARRGASPRVLPKQPPQTLWTAAAAPASELRPSGARPLGVPICRAQLRSTSLAGCSLTLHPAALVPSPASQSCWAESPGPQRRGPRVGSGSPGRGPRSRLLCCSFRCYLGVLGPQIQLPRSERTPLPSFSLEMQRSLRGWGLTTLPTFSVLEC